jgi:pre-rRNA-processing protein TSR2
VFITMDEFLAGVTACLRSWSALRTAVQNEWGGPTSIEKAEALRNEIIDCMLQKRISDIIDLEDALAIYMEEEFSIVLDDHSDKQVAATIYRMYEEVNNSMGQHQEQRLTNASYIMQIIQMAEKVTKEFGHLPLHIQSSEPMDDDMDNEGNDQDEMDTNTSNMEGNAISQTEHVKTTTDVPVPDNSTTNVAEYASQPLFGLSREQRRIQIIQKNAQQKLVRQLGESEPCIVDVPKQNVVVDDDGFICVSSNRRNKPK